MYYNEDSQLPEGFRHLTEDEIYERFKKLDVDGSFTITKNEWMASALKPILEDVSALDEKAPDYIMKLIWNISNDFDNCDIDHNKEIDFDEYKALLQKTIIVPIEE